MLHQHLKRRALWTVLVMAAAGRAAAQEAGNLPVKAGDGLFRFVLVDGTSIAGKLSLPQILLETEFGPLLVPAKELARVVPGLDHRPDEKAAIEELIEMLGKGAPHNADARAELIRLGPGVSALLREHREQANDKIQDEIDIVLTALEENAQEELDEGPRLIPQDSVQTARFTAVGRLPSQQFKIETRFGDLTVTWADVVHFENFDPDSLPDARKVLAVDATNLVQTKFKSSGIKVQPGDRIIVQAGGQIARSTSKTYTSTPDGNTRLGTFSQSPPILGGALVARIGPSGNLIKVGSKNAFVAKQAGLLQFAIALRPTTSKLQYAGKYDVTVRVLRGAE
jgi:hypothetical protein